MSGLVPIDSTINPSSAACIGSRKDKSKAMMKRVLRNILYLYDFELNLWISWNGVDKIDKDINYSKWNQKEYKANKRIYSCHFRFLQLFFASKCLCVLYTWPDDRSDCEKGSERNSAISNEDYHFFHSTHSGRCQTWINGRSILCAIRKELGCASSHITVFNPCIYRISKYYQYE